MFDVDVFLINVVLCNVCLPFISINSNHRMKMKEIVHVFFYNFYKELVNHIKMC